MAADYLSAMASLGTLAVVVATAIAAFVQLRHMSVTNRLMVLNSFREEFERLEGPAAGAMALVHERLGDPQARHELHGVTAPPWVRPVLPLMRLFEVLGTYTNRDFVPRDLVCDLWSPVILRWWNECAPLVAVWRRSTGPTLFENFESIAVASQQWLSHSREIFPKDLPRIVLEDPWADEDRAAAGPTIG